MTQAELDVSECRAIVARLSELGVPDHVLEPIEEVLDEADAWQTPIGPCLSCSHDPACGMASVWTGDVQGWYCHADDHSCYEQAATLISVGDAGWARLRATTDPGTSADSSAG